MSGRVRVAEIGNVVPGNVGFALQVAGRLACEPLPDNVCVRDLPVREDGSVEVRES